MSWRKKHTVCFHLMEVICMTYVYTLFSISQNFGNRTESNRQKNKWKFLFSGDTALSMASLGCQKYKRVENTIRCIHEGKVLWDILKNKDRNTIPSSGSPWRAGFQAWKVLPEAVSALAPLSPTFPRLPFLTAVRQSCTYAYIAPSV